jgi:hypothetical protein
MHSELSLFGERLSISSKSSQSTISLSRAHTAEQRFSLPKPQVRKPTTGSNVSLSTSFASAPSLVIKSATTPIPKPIKLKPKLIRRTKKKDDKEMDTRTEKKPSKFNKDEVSEGELHERMRRRAQLLMLNQLMTKLQDAKLIENQSV